ncbi:respiratory supercomplex factor 1-like protein [Dinothrombium tinctorium]|uniref:Respiratory supercomplex factor 1-like protein n=1 Tax=Dinothrombium tinctorium TaxID=1965070 RepID=A0A3S3S1L7_9ACAR|nr:respiratory supercomplex factor 1-like protein [Dinothrombium tinctorium]RWS07902.1 respiratory supercomplex factor 1-like protein [Dinothrombium tinctorium]RWS07908.1 respiratory supercomplex factor 1-like protein [Dinothrombium tinctorium]
MSKSENEKRETNAKHKTVNNDSDSKANGDVIDLSNTQDLSDLEWVQLMNEIHGDERFKPKESFWGRTKRKFSENPLVPIGIAATTFFLCRGLGYMLKKDVKKQQLMMRSRVAAQGFTIVALLFSFTLLPKINERLRSRSK